MKTVDLVGTRVLDARGEYISPDDPSRGRDSALVVLLRIDAKFYAFEEDPSDGYRSAMCDLREATDVDMALATIAVFPPIVCEFRVRTNGEHHSTDDVLYAVNEVYGLVILEIGTSNVDDWYPCFVSVWRPEGYELAVPR